MESQTARDAQFERQALACLPDVARFAHSLVRDPVAAEDLVQETFLHAYRGYHSFRHGADVRRWLFAICHNAWLRSIARDQRHVITTDGDDAELEALAAAREHAVAHRQGIDEFMDNVDVRPAILAAIDQLAPDFRAVVELVDVQEFGYEEAAHVLGVPIGTVRSRLFRARRLLQTQLIGFARDAGVRAPASPASPPETEIRS